MNRAKKIPLSSLLAAAVLCAGCDRPAPAPAAAEPPLAITIDRTKGKVTPASVGWPASAGNKVWITGRDGHATVTVAEGLTQSFDFDGFSMMAVNGELEAVEFWLPGEPFDDAYRHATAMATAYELGPMQKLEDWYAIDRPHQNSFVSGVGRHVGECAFGITISTTHIPRTQAVIKVGYNFGVAKRYIEAGGTLR